MLAGTASRTLRHYDDIGLLPPSRIGHNGHRYHDEATLIRLQRVLLLRELGLSLPRIAESIETEADEAAALTTHLSLLRQDQERFARQIAAVQRPAHKDEVVQRWGKEAYAGSDSWWRSLDKHGQEFWKSAFMKLNTDWIAAAKDSEAPRDPRGPRTWRGATLPG